jgi:hypothetical protein
MDRQGVTEMAEAKQASKPQIPKIEWDDTNMQTTYSNVANAASTREEFTILFGTNKTWNPGKDKQVTVELTDRMVMNPYAAKRLYLLLGGVIKEYESRYGPIQIQGVDTGAAN